MKYYNFWNLFLWSFFFSRQIMCFKYVLLLCQNSFLSLTVFLYNLHFWGGWDSFIGCPVLTISICCGVFPQASLGNGSLENLKFTPSPVFYLGLIPHRVSHKTITWFFVHPVKCTEHVIEL